MLTTMLALAATIQGAQSNCRNPQTQLDMNSCAGDRFGQADGQLNRVYRDIVREAQAADRGDADVDTSHPNNEEALRASQRAWVAFRDAQCQYESFEARGGSMQPMLYENCRARMTRERIQQLTHPEHLGN